MAAVVAGAIALIGGFAVGWIVARRRTHRPVLPVRAPVDVSSDSDDLAPLLREAVDHLEIGVVVISSSGMVQYRNASARSFAGTYVGLLLEEQIGKIASAARSGQRSERIVELAGPPRAWLQVAADPMPGGAVVTMQDMSERVRIDAMRTDFVTNISHELKTPVGAVAVLAEALAEESDPEVVQRVSGHLVEESHRAVRTIDDLLKLSTIESTRPGDAVVDLTSVVQAAIGRGRVVDGGRGVRISAFDTTCPILIRGDERQLVSAIGNLVENAVKYSQPGDLVQVRIRCDERSVEVMVTDQGIGIPSRDLDRIFERFYRVDKARSRATGGSGLGLSIVRHVATNHGGEVVVSSQEGQGSTFVLRLPSDLLVDADSARTPERNGPAIELTPGPMDTVEESR